MLLKKSRKKNVSYEESAIVQKDQK